MGRAVAEAMQLRQIGFHTADRITIQVAQLYRRETAALQGGLIIAKSGRLELGDNIVRTL